MTLLDGQTGGGGQGGQGGGGAAGGGQGGAGAAGGQGGGAGAQGGGQGGSAGGGQGGGAQSNWYDAFPDELKSNPTITSFKTPEALAKSFLETKSMVGKKGLVVPGQNATDAEWDEFFNGAGRPSIDKFDIKAPEGKQVNTEVLGKFKEVMHKAGLLPRQAQSIVEAYIGFEEETQKTRMTSHQAAVNEGIESLKKEWGAGWDKNVAAAKLFIREHGGEGAIEWQQRTGMGNDPTFLKILAKAGGLMGEDKLRGEGGGSLGQTPDEIQKEINAVLGNRQHPYYQSRHPGHKQALKEMEERYKKLHPPRTA